MGKRDVIFRETTLETMDQNSLSAGCKAHWTAPPGPMGAVLDEYYQKRKEELRLLFKVASYFVGDMHRAVRHAHRGNEKNSPEECQTGLTEIRVSAICTVVL